jgi:lysophospholipase L1-like esterase
VVAAGLISATARATEYAADDSLLSYEGRTWRTADHRVKWGFPGITLRVRANATELRLHLNASNDTVYFDLSVDGGAAQLIHASKGEGTLTLYRGLLAGTHQVALIRRTESWQGTCDILGLSADGGTLLPPPSLPVRKLMFIGDSVTCGQGTEPERATEVQNPLRANAAASYGMLLARRFGAQCDLVSYGGRGVIRDWQGNRTSVTGPQFYELALPDDPTSYWDHSSYIPDAIGVALGTNDFSRGIPDENEFVNAYVEFVRKLQRDAPKAKILLIDSPILNDGPNEPPKRSALGAFLDEVVAKVGSPRVTHGRTKHYVGAKDDAHPTAADHVGIADELEPQFRTALGW